MASTELNNTPSPDEMTMQVFEELRKYSEFWNRFLTKIGKMDAARIKSETHKNRINMR